MGAKRKRRDLGSRRRWAKRCVNSGLTQRAFAAEHELCVGSLGRWVREFRRSREEQDGELAGFVEVTAAKPAPPPPPAMAVRVIVGSVTLEFGQLPPADYVAALGRISC